MDQVSDYTNVAMMRFISFCKDVQHGDNVRFVNLYLLQTGLWPALQSLITVDLTTMRSAFAAIKNGKLDALTAALDAGTDLSARDENGWTLLAEAINYDQFHMVDMLLSRGAHVHQKDLYGWTALHLAARKWRSDMLFRTVFSAAGHHAMNFPTRSGQTPLHLLARFGSTELHSGS
jgi:ankyrin repeat protein